MKHTIKRILACAFGCALLAGGLYGQEKAPPAPEKASAPAAESKAEAVLPAKNNQAGKVQGQDPNAVLKGLGKEVKIGDLMAMERMLSMPAERIREAAKALEKIAAMTDEERAQLRERVRTFRMMNEEKRRSLFYEFQHTSPRDRDLVKRYFQTLDKAEQRKIREQTSNLKGPQRVAYHNKMLAKAKAAGIEPNLKLSDIPGSDVRGKAKMGARRKVPGPQPPPPPEGMKRGEKPIPGEKAPRPPVRPAEADNSEAPVLGAGEAQEVSPPPVPAGKEAPEPPPPEPKPEAVSPERPAPAGEDAPPAPAEAPRPPAPEPVAAED